MESSLEQDFVPKKATEQPYCRVSETEEQLFALEPAWNELFSSCSLASPFTAWDWAREWWVSIGSRPRQGAPRSIPLVLSVYSEKDELIGILPFHYPANLGPTLNPCPLRPFGALGYQEDGMTEQPIMLLRRHWELRGLEAAIHCLTRLQQERGWDFLQLQLQHKKGLLMALMSRSIGLRKRLQTCREYPVPELVLPDDWEALLSRLSKSMRDNLKYYPRLLARHGKSWRVWTASEPEEVDRMTDALVDLHRSRAQSTRGVQHRDHIPTQTHYCFLKRNLVYLAEREEASISVLEIDGRIAAAQSILIAGEAVLLYYSGFDPQWYDYSPLTILHAEIIKQAIATGMSRINFLSSEHPWKMRWGARSETSLQDVICIRPHVRSILRTALYLAPSHHNPLHIPK